MPAQVTAAMSGGVDSSVAAYLLMKEGYRVVGSTMKLYRPNLVLAPDGQPMDIGGTVSCGSDQDIHDARVVCDSLGIPHTVCNFGEKFCRTIIADFISEYEKGATPNPCVLCNKLIKFGALLDQAQADGSDYIATGHYARIEKDPNGRYLLKTAADASRDQTYVLWQLSQETLSHVLLPLGSWFKPDIRALADELHLPTAHKSDSQDICFVPDGDYARFMIRYTGREPTPGDYVDEDGNILGPHQGIIHYTVGQRKGLGIALGQPMFVKSKDPATRRVVLTTNDRLFERTVYLEDVNLIATDRLDQPTRAEAKIRYGHHFAKATVTQTGERSAIVTFDEPQRAPAAGQSCVFYDGDTVIGGGIIRGTAR